MMRESCSWFARQIRSASVFSVRWSSVSVMFVLPSEDQVIEAGDDGRCREDLAAQIAQPPEGGAAESDGKQKQHLHSFGSGVFSLRHDGPVYAGPSSFSSRMASSLSLSSTQRRCAW